MSTSTTDRFSPDNPRPWTTAHLSLTEPSIARAPHESAGILRMNRAGMKGPRIIEKLGMRPEVFESRFYRAIGAEETAAKSGRPLFDAAIDPARADW